MSIEWGKIEFTSPQKITSWDPPYKAALYAIMVKPEPSSKPNTFRIIYFGESENLSERGFYKSHHRYQCWKDQAGSDDNIYIGIHAMPGSSESDRKKAEKSLIDQYKPDCND